MTAKPQTPLVKKHSQTDLVSRLKTRKVLGVGGEDNDGEAHRSKISQVLGNETKFAMREPIGLRLWMFLSAVLFTAVALIALVFPSQLYQSVFELSSSEISVRLYGGALLSVSFIMWNGLYTAEKVIIQWTLLTQACYLAVQFLVTSFSLLGVQQLSRTATLVLLTQVLSLLTTLLYYRQMRRKTKKT